MEPELVEVLQLQVYHKNAHLTQAKPRNLLGTCKHQGSTFVTVVIEVLCMLDSCVIEVSISPPYLAQMSKN